MTKQYKFVKENPIARFYYKGQSHDHPVRRTIIVTKEGKNHITGYEIREGRQVRLVSKAPIKTYRLDRIATYGQYSRLKMNKENYNRLDSETTLVRSSLEDLVRTGA